MSAAKRPDPDKPFFTPEQETLIREHLLKDAPELEIQRFLITCHRTGLDPFTRQIYGHIQRKKVKRGNEEIWVPSVVIMTSIDGFRAIAERSGEYRGQTAPEWYYVDDEGKSDWHNVCIVKRDQRHNPIGLPSACRVGILRQGFEQPCYGVANFDSFAKWIKGDDGYYLDTFWRKMPEHMIAKIAEAQGHRKAFPLLAHGIYIEEEVRDDDEPEVTPPARSEALPEGATWVPGHSPEERAAASKKPAEGPVAEIGSTTPPIEEKPAGEAPAKRAPRQRKTAPAQDSTPEPAAQKPADPGPFGEEAPVSPPAWQNAVIEDTVLNVKRVTGKTVGQLTADDVKWVYNEWVVKYHDKFAQNKSETKLALARHIEKAFIHHHGKPAKTFFE